MIGHGGYAMMSRLVQKRLLYPRVPRVTGQILVCRFVPTVVGFKKGGGIGGSWAHPQDFLHI